jgi:hypothetical protein
MTRALYIALGAIVAPALVVALCIGLAVLPGLIGTVPFEIVAVCLGVAFFGLLGAGVGDSLYLARRRRWR